MNPLEVLRWIARLEEEDPQAVALSALQSLEELADRPEMLYVAVRQLLAAQPRNGGLWSVGNRLLLALDPHEEAWSIRRELSRDSTLGELRAMADAGVTLYLLDVDRAYRALAGRRGSEHAVYYDPSRGAQRLLSRALSGGESALVIEPWSFSDGGAIISREHMQLAERAVSGGLGVLCRVPDGFELPARLFEAQARLLAKALGQGGEDPEAECLADLYGLPAFRANPELVTFLFGANRERYTASVAEELLAL
ncbi:MAG: hypothetical protein M0Z91_09575 [Actinomycetota bacterium]|nr:hypothetical protein [Actinomycetota bacterium]